MGLILEGNEARKAYTNVETRGRAGLFQQFSDGIFTVFDHRSGAWRETRLRSRESALRWIQKGG